jgi:hypothetical protein
LTIPSLGDSHYSDFARLSAVTDPAQRARQATVLLGQCARAAEALARVRRDAVVAMHDGGRGMSRQEIADILGISKARAGHILTLTDIAQAGDQADSLTAGPGAAWHPHPEMT